MPPSRRLAPVAVLVLALITSVAGCDRSPPTPDRPTPSATRQTTRHATSGDLIETLDGVLDDAAAGPFRNLEAVVVTVDGRTVYERYLLISPGTSTDVESTGRTILATLIGIALHEGKFSGLDETLAELLPDHRADMSAQVAGITLQQLLTMTAGLMPDETFYPGVTAREQDWVRFILRHPLRAPPGERFIYSGADSHLLSAVLSEATGVGVLDYARQKLFDPLGIVTTPAVDVTLGKNDLAAYIQAGFSWPTDPQGRYLGTGSMKLTTLDLVKLGQLWLDRGAWQGRQLVPADWADRMQRQQVATEYAHSAPGYGYQQWVAEADGHHAFAAVGDGGQLVEVVPDLGLVVVFVSAVTLDTTAVDLVGVADSNTYRSIVNTTIAPRIS